MYQLDKPDNLVEFFENSVKKFSDRPLFGTKNKSGTYDWIIYKEFGQRMDNLRGGLAGLGIGKDDVVGIIANNRVEWAVAHLRPSVSEAGSFPYTKSSFLTFGNNIVKDSDIKVLFVSKEEKNGMLTPTLKLKRYCVR